MTSSEILAAAIEKLEELRESTDAVYIEAADDRDQSMVNALYATIEPVLAILRAALDDFTKYGNKPSKFFANDVALASAILSAGEQNT